GSWTATPFWSIGVMTMKMMSSTRQTSTSGAMLMAAFSLSRPVSIPMVWPSGEGTLRGQRDAGRAALDEVVDQLGRGVRHLDLEALDLVQEDVEHPDGEDGDDQAGGRGDEGFRDTRGHRADAARSGHGHAGERVDDPDDRAEQADEHGDRADRRQPGEAALEVGHDEQRLSLDGALRGLDHVVADDATASGRRVVLELEK